MRTKGFTLIELLVVISIIATLAVAVFTALNPVKRFAESRNSRRLSDVENILNALSLYEIDNNGTFPAGLDSNLRMLGTDTGGCDVSCGGAASVSSSTISVRVATGNDDAEEQNPPNGTLSRYSSDLELVSDAGVDQEVGIRFTNIEIPQGVSITNANIEFTVDELDSGTANLIIYGENSDNALGFSSSAGDITNRTKTTANVSWSNLPAWTTVGNTHQTPNLSSVVQEIIDRPGWNTGNSMVFTIDGTGERTAESYNGISSSAPLLLVSYEVATGSGELTESSCLNLSTSLSKYLKTIPIDPLNGSSSKTNYAVKILPSGIKSVVSCGAENDEDIKINR